MEVRTVFLLVMMVNVSLVSADITFFEGDEGSFIVSGGNNVDATSVYCGNAICDSGEDCGNCMSDCGSCGGSTGIRTFPVEVVDDVREVEVEYPFVDVIEFRDYSLVLGAGMTMTIVFVNAAVLGLLLVWGGKKVQRRRKRK